MKRYRRHWRAIFVVVVLGLGLGTTLLFLATIVLAQPETWYLRSGAGAACGPGDRESLNLLAGSSVATKDLDGTGDSWNRVESTACSIAPGDWQVFFDSTLNVAAVPPDGVTVLVERRNVSCALQQTIINEEVLVVQVLPLEYSTLATNPGRVDFNAGDILLVTLSQSSGSDTVTLRYGNTAGSDADTRLVHPDTLTEVPVADTTGLTETVQGSSRINASESASLGDSVLSGVSASLSSISSLQESVNSIVQRINQADFSEDHFVTEGIQAALAVRNSDTSTFQESVTFVVTRADSNNDSDDDVSVPSLPEEAPKSVIEVPEIPEIIEEIVPTAPREPAEALEPLGKNLVRLWHFDNTTKEWAFYDPRSAFGAANTIAEVVPQNVYWVRVEQDQIVTLNGKQRNLYAGWNLIGW